jgi:hypothetical protein
MASGKLSENVCLACKRTAVENENAAIFPEGRLDVSHKGVSRDLICGTERKTNTFGCEIKWGRIHGITLSDNRRRP